MQICPFINATQFTLEEFTQGHFSPIYEPEDYKVPEVVGDITDKFNGSHRPQYKQDEKMWYHLGLWDGDMAALGGDAIASPSDEPNGQSKHATDEDDADEDDGDGGGDATDAKEVNGPAKVDAPILVQTTSTSAKQDCSENVHLLPCSIQMSGPAPVSTFFHPTPNPTGCSLWLVACGLWFFYHATYLTSTLHIQGDGKAGPQYYTAYLRGRQMTGEVFKLPKGAKGWMNDRPISCSH